MKTTTSIVKRTALLLPLLLLAAGARADELNGADTAWILTSTALVLFMTIPGLSLFYAGLVRVKNVLSVLMQCFALTCLMSLLWFALGYTIAFGSDGVEQGKWIGDFGNMFFANITMDSMNGGIPASLFAIFQMTFAIITPAQKPSSSDISPFPKCTSPLPLDSRFFLFFTSSLSIYLFIPSF